MSANQWILLLTLGLSGLCLLVAFLKSPGRGVLYFVRGVFHVLLLYGIQLLCIKMGWGMGVTVNAATGAVSAVLGIPGIALLYGLKLL